MIPAGSGVTGVLGVAGRQITFRQTIPLRLKPERVTTITIMSAQIVARICTAMADATLGLVAAEAARFTVVLIML